MLEFEWDDEKAANNLAKHGVAFPDARRLFDDIHALHYSDRSMHYEEERFIGIGIVNGLVLTVVYTERGDRIRLISARKRRAMSRKHMTKHAGTESDWDRLRTMSDAEAEAGALADKDNPPLSTDRPGPAPVARVKVIRRALHLTQEEFSVRYRIPLGTLRDWEQGRTEPDQAAQAYLQVIATEPETVSRALGTRSAA